MAQYFTSKSSSGVIARRILCFVSLLLMAGCFHYTPSRKEIAQTGDNPIAGPEAFQAYQAELRTRFDNLLKERAPLLTADAEKAYKIGPRDVLKIDVFGFSDLSGEMEVTESGSISLPLLGTIPAAGKTVAELQEELTQREKRYVKAPIVRLTVSTYNANRVSVVGSVPKPGWYPFKRAGYLLTDLLTEVGGVKDNAGNKVYLIPAQRDQPALLANNTVPTLSTAVQPAPPTMGKVGVEIDIDELVGTLDKPPVLIPLLPGDTVIVPEAGQFRVGGEVENPGTFGVSRKATTLAAIAAAGGFTYAANVYEVEVIRDVGAGKKASITVDLEKVAFRGETDITLRDGDVVIVPSAPGRFRARQVVEAFRTVLRGGVTGSIKYQ